MSERNGVNVNRLVSLSRVILDGKPSCYCAASSPDRMGGPHASDCQVGIYFKQRKELDKMLREYEANAQADTSK